jgi:hypothetical protein
MRLGQAQALETEKAKMMNQMWAADAAAKTNEMGVEVDDGLIRIGEMAKRHGVTLRTLRFYEDKGLLAPRREGNTRQLAVFAATYALGQLILLSSALRHLVD